MNHNGHGKSRDDLARQANQVRSKLLRTVEVLDQRRHEALDLKLQVQRHVRQIVAMAGIALVLSAGLVAFAVYRISTAPERRRRDRVRLVRHMWHHPDRVIRGAKREGRHSLVELGRSVLLGIASTALLLPARRVVTQLLEERAEDRKKAAPQR
jgi:tRNA/tmRNA/rRNA uracil-C5-methylase (TrmA/RlmC/RlmD family)